MTTLSKEAARSRARRAAAKAGKTATAKANADVAKMKATAKTPAKPKPSKAAKVWAGQIVRDLTRKRKAEPVLPAGDRMIVISFKGTPEHKATLTRLGGGVYMRKLLDAKA